MGTGQKRNIAVVPQARAALTIRNEVAKIGYHSGHLGDIRHTCGAVGGHGKADDRAAEQSLSNGRFPARAPQKQLVGSTNTQCGGSRLPSVFRHHRRSKEK